jgi:hypothetical protein
MGGPAITVDCPEPGAPGARRVMADSMAAVSARPSLTRRAKIPRSRRQGWPKRLACLACDKLRLAEHAGDRLHPKLPRGGGMVAATGLSLAPRAS